MLWQSYKNTPAKRSLPQYIDDIQTFVVCHKKPHTENTFFFYVCQILSFLRQNPVSSVFTHWSLAICAVWSKLFPAALHPLNSNFYCYNCYGSLEIGQKKMSPVCVSVYVECISWAIIWQLTTFDIDWISARRTTKSHNNSLDGRDSFRNKMLTV